MTGVLITLGIGLAIIFFEWRLATKPDEKDKHKRRRKLSPVDLRRIRDLLFMTVVVAGIVWILPRFF
jgi:hypothetical protein